MIFENACGDIIDGMTASEEIRIRGRMSLLFGRIFRRHVLQDCESLERWKDPLARGHLTLMVFFEEWFENLDMTGDLFPRARDSGIVINSIRDQFISTTKLSIQHVFSSAHRWPSYEG